MKTLGSYTAPKRPYKLVWTDSCRYTQSFATYAAALRSALTALPYRGVPCAWIITCGGETLKAGVA